MTPERSNRFGVLRMSTTSTTLLQRLRLPDAAKAWPRFVDLYAPLFHFWVKRAGLSDADANDVVQEVFLLLMHALPKYEYTSGKSFRNWLRVVVLNKVREFCRRRRSALATTEEIELLDDGVDPAVLFEEDDYQSFLLRRACLLMKSDFQETTWRACWCYVAEGRPAAEVAEELGISLNAVYLATSRVLRRLRQELADLMD